MFGWIKDLFKKRDKNKTPSIEEGYPALKISPEISEAEEIENRLSQKFREVFLDGSKDVSTLEVKEDLERLWELTNPSAEWEPLIVRWQSISLSILKKNPEIWKRIQEDIQKKVENNKFDFQDPYIQVCPKKGKAHINFVSYILPLCSDDNENEYFIITLEEEDKIKYIDRKTLGQLERELLENGYKYIRTMENGYLVYFKSIP